MYTFPKYVWEVVGQRVPHRIRAKCRQDGDFFLVYNLCFLGRAIIVLNYTSGTIYNLCDGKHTINDIIQELKKEYPDIAEEKLTEDVHSCIRNPENKRLLTVVEEKYLRKGIDVASCGCS